MIIPVRCFTCGKVLADKWQAYERMCSERQAQASSGPAASSVPSRPAPHATGPSGKPPQDGGGDGAALVLDSYQGPILDSLGITRMCCRRHMLTHVELIDII